jgi:alanine racemase/UDP-N-acetylmuramoyl-tripeptide--D-alanyl-D-alanine ligase
MPQNRKFTERQFNEFQKAVAILENAGFKKLVKHAAATGGVIASSKYHLDAVRIGTGLHGILPSGKRYIPNSHELGG